MPKVLQPGGWRSGRGFDPRLGVNPTRQFHSKHMVKARPLVALAVGPCVWVGNTYVLKHKLRTGPWVVLTDNDPCVWVDAGFMRLSQPA
jgi:hypothetical protein